MNRVICQAEPRKAALRLPVFICVLLWVLPLIGQAQEREPDIVLTLATGRVIISVGAKGIVIGALEGPAKSGSCPPLIVPVGGRRLGILLGAVEWAAHGRALVRFDRVLPALASEVTRPRPAKDPQPTASDIESLGVAFLERLRAVAQELHHKLDLRPQEPLVELLLVGYEENYGPEVWLLKYRVAQEASRGDYWRTRVLRPSYTQLYPPEKGQPRTLIEVRFPDESGPTLLELLRQKDPRLVRIAASDARIARAAEYLDRGESQKALAGDTAEWLRATLGAVRAADERQILGVLYEERDLEWLLAPPERPEKAQQEKPRETGAPTLRKKPLP
ncbi:MAG TPA: hypothetical protein VKE24_04405 [Candidatus Acidoferrales bacterium]|nr:hypothetical protein [Candidatus Acidoferrales bacterium]